ncbi:flippase-like domain-containing protein [Flaviaesturariibacter flavus]|uniref:Flippase-like domain-containing protein n=2 Tax=Flaviaesturariibacter flavus TaxID=2502780 RepID=A0A4R1BN03_9BACT|nr:flippase-like domain-containing protein [Flaviaesturariibacter flavus]
MIFEGLCKVAVIFTAMRAGKISKKFSNYFLGPLLFSWLLYSIGRQLQHQPQLLESWGSIRASFHSPRIVYFIALCLLMLANWGIEALKWRMLVRPIEPISFGQSFRAVLSGVSFSVSTPNRVGEYLGRMLYMPEGKRLQVVALTLVGSLAQLLLTLWAGTIAFIFLYAKLTGSGMMHPFVYRVGLAALVLGTGVLTLFYFNIAALEKWLERLLRKASWLYLVAALKEFGMQRLSRLLGLSAVRYAVFVVQYLLAFRLFSVDVSLLQAVGVMGLVFLALAIIPSVVLLEVGIRGEVSLKLIGLFSANSLGIIVTTVTIWLINLVLPALAGSLLILGVKIFKKRYEER